MLLPNCDIKPDSAVCGAGQLSFSFVMMRLNWMAL